MTRSRSFLSALLLAGCATFHNSRGPVVDIVASDPSREVDALVDEFFGLGATSPRFLDQLSEALQKNPQSGAVHEIAAYWAMLEGDDSVSFEEFLRAAADKHNPNAALDILEAVHQNRTRGELISTVDTLEAIAQVHPDPPVRAEANHIRAIDLRRLGRLDDARQAVALLGFIPRFQIMGAFDNEDGKGFTEAYPPEHKLDLAATATGSVVTVGWRRAAVSDLSGQIPLFDLVYPNAQAVAYAAVWIQAPNALEATLRISADGPAAAWLDQTEVVREDRVRHLGLDNVTAPVALQAGWNELLIKSATKAGPWNLAVRFTDRSGNPLPLATSDVPPAGPIGEKTAVLAANVAASPGNPGSREAFTAARMKVLRGLSQPGLAELENLLDVARDNPLLRYYTADAAVSDRQTERALDLLTSGISKERAIPAFLRARAELYQQKDLYNQAQRDLDRAIESQPNARLAQLDLAELLGKRSWNGDRVRLLNKILRRWPDSPFAAYALGVAYEAEGYQTRAEEAYRRAYDLEPGGTNTLRSLRKLYDRQNRSGDAADMFDRLAEINPTNVEDQIARAEDQRLAGHVQDADVLLKAVSLQSPDNPAPYLRRSSIAEGEDRIDEAIELLQQAQLRDPRDSWVSERLQHLRPPKEDALSAYTPSDDDIEAAVHRASAAADPASHVEVLLFDKANLLNSDGSQRWVETEVLRPLSQQGRDELVRMALPTGGTVRVLKAFAQTSEGHRQDASSVEKTSVRFRNLAVGSTVVLQFAYYPRHSGPMQDDFWSDVSFAWFGRHVDRMSWTLVSPRSKTIYLEVDPRVKQTQEEVGDRLVHRFEAENVAALSTESGMVPAPELVPHVSATTLPNWESFIHWEKALLDESFPVDPTIDALAAHLTAGAATPREKLAKLFGFVAQEIRYQQEYESILAGWQPHRSAVVLERKYGDCKDKATLLIALSKSVGIQVQFAVLATRKLGHLKRGVVYPEFNHAIAYVPQQAGFEEPFFIDPTVDALDLWNLREDDQGSSGLVLDPGTGKWSWIDIPYQAPAFQMSDWKLDVQVDSPERATANSHLVVRGTVASSARKALRTEGQSRQFYQYLAAFLFPGAKLTSASAPDHESIAHPLTIDEVIDASSAIHPEGEHFRLQLPAETQSGLTKLDQRQTPLDLGPPNTSRVQLVVHLKQGLQLVDKPAPVEVKDPCFHVRRTIEGDKTRVVITDEVEQTCTRITVADYPRYRANMERARSLMDSAVVFDKAKTLSAER